MQRAILFTVSLVVSLVLVELGLTLFYTGAVGDGPLEAVPEWASPFVFRARPGGEINAYSIRRSRPMNERPDPGVTRILSYGDSIAEGYALPETDTYAYQLERNLEASSGGRVEILNMDRGHSPSVHAFHLRSDVPRFAPDGVLLEIELLNDVSDEAHVRISGSDEDGLPLELHRHRYILGWDGQLLAPLALSGSFVERTKLFAKLSRWVGRLLDRIDPNPLFTAASREFYYSSSADRAFLTRRRLDEGFERLFTAVAGIHRYLERRDVEFLLVILPSREAFSADRFGPAAREILARAERRARELEIPYIAPTTLLAARGGEALYMDFCHPTAAGHRAIADALEPALRRWAHRSPATASQPSTMLPGQTQETP